jgi:hypothetical protein
MAGSFNPAGFRLSTAPDGRPVFRPANVTGAGDEKWQDGFGVPGVLGAVSAVAVSGSDVYVGGAFAHAGGVSANHVARWDGVAWTALGAGVNGDVYALAVSGADVYVGGRFTTAGAVAAQNVARWDGTSWSSLGSGLNSVVYALAARGNDLYAGGGFNYAGGVPASYAARWDGAAWSALNTGMNAPVRTLVMAGAVLYAGGSFTQAGSVSARYLARWNGAAWDALGAGVNGDVYALAVSGADVYAGGRFTTAGAGAAQNVARWDGTSWNGLGTGQAQAVYALGVSGTDVFVGCPSNAIGPLGNVARWNGTTWATLGAGVNASASALAVAGNGEVYVGGEFFEAGSLETQHIAKWHGNAWSALGTASLNAEVTALAVSGPNIYVGGTFTQAGGGVANKIARWNGSSWSSLGPGLNGDVSALIVNASGDLYAGGFFTQAGALSARYVARWDGAAWHALGTGMDNPVLALALAANGDLLAGGGFNLAGGVVANSVARWNGSSWSSLGAGLNSVVLTMAVRNNELYVGGSFSTAGGVAASNVAKWNGSAWSALGTGANSFFVRALVVSGTDVYMGGDFTRAGNVTVNHVAKWNGSSWSALGTGVNGNVYDLGVSATGDVYAVGNFTAAGAVAARSVARWNGTAWSALGTGINGQVNKLAIAGADVCVGGEFATVGDGSKVSNRFGIYHEVPTLALTSFSPTSGPVGAAVVITGTNFSGATAVAFNGVSATSFTVNSATSITAVVPAGAGTGRLSVTTPAGTATSINSFAVTLAPTIAGFSPGSGPVNSDVIISGTGFIGTTAVAFNGTVAPGFRVSSATRITVPVPVGTTSGNIRVTTPAGTATSAGSFTVLADPVVSSFSPASGPEATVVVITGANFSGATQVWFNGTPASFVLNSATQLTATVPAGASTGPIGVNTGGNTSFSALPFTVTVLPTITSFSPGAEKVGQYVFLTGNNFVNVSDISFNGTPVTNFYLNSPTSITTFVPYGASTGPISVTCPAGTGTSATAFTVLPSLPSFTSVTPGRGPVGASITIKGRFFANTTAIDFNGTLAPGFVVTGDTMIVVTVPSGATTGILSVTTSVGTTNYITFTVTVPVIYEIRPAGARVGEGIVIRGNFLDGATSVQLNGMSLPFTTNIVAELLVTLPAGASSGLLTVDSPSGVSNGMAFAVLPPATPAPAWQQAMGVNFNSGLGGTAGQGGLTTATDAAGNVYIAGAFAGTLQLGNTTLQSANSSPDMFVAKWSPVSNSFVWAQRGGGLATEGAYGVAVSGSNVYVIGAFSSNTANFGSTVLTNALSGGGQEDVFVVKLSDAGTSASFVWAQRVGGTHSDIGTSLAVNGTNVYVAGTFRSFAVTFSNSPATLTNWNGNGVANDIFIARLSDLGSTSTFDWVQKTGAIGHSETITALAVNGNSLYLTGGSTGYPIFGSFTLVNNSQHSGALGGFVAKLTDTGGSSSWNWAEWAGNEAKALALSGASVYVSGRFGGAASFGSTVLTSAGTTDTFVAKLVDAGSTASWTWTQQLPGYNMVLALAASGRNVYLAGGFNNATASFGGAMLASGSTIANYEVFVAKLTDAGSSSSFAWARSAGGWGSELAQTIWLSGSSVYVMGTGGMGTLNFDNQYVGSAGSVFFLASLNDPTLTATTSNLGSFGFGLYPNPAHGTATVLLPATPGAAQATLTLLDALGRVIQTQRVALPSAGLSHELNLRGVAPGVYVLRAQAGTTTAVRRLVVE